MKYRISEVHFHKNRPTLKVGYIAEVWVKFEGAPGFYTELTHSRAVQSTPQKAADFYKEWANN